MRDYEMARNTERFAEVLVERHKLCRTLFGDHQSRLPRPRCRRDFRMGCSSHGMLGLRFPGLALLGFLGRLGLGFLRAGDAR